MRHFQRFATNRTVAIALVFSCLGAGNALAKRRTFTFGYDQPRTTGYGVAADIFNAKLMEVSGGQLGVDQFPNAQLGQEPVMLQKVRSGDIDLIISSAANASTVAPQAGVMSLHYLFRDQGHLRRAIADQGVVAATKEMVSESVQGAFVLCLETLGFRNLYGKKAVRTVGDLKGTKIRVQATKTEDAHFAGYGAQTVHMPFGEVYTSLQTGVVQMAENGINIYLSNKHYEVAPIMSMTEHEANNGFIWISSKTWNSLNEQEKKWVEGACAEVARVQPDRALRLENESLARLEKMGVKIIHDVDKSGFMKAARPVQDALAAELGAHATKILQRIRNVQ